jgi:hypothetical protein
MLLERAALVYCGWEAQIAAVGGFGGGVTKCSEQHLRREKLVEGRKFAKA